MGWGQKRTRTAADDELGAYIRQGTTIGWTSWRYIQDKDSPDDGLRA